jgi:hypothetical protein
VAKPSRIRRNDNAGQDGGQDGGQGGGEYGGNNLHILQDGGQYSGGYLWSFPSLWTGSGPLLFRPTLPGWMHAFPYSKTDLVIGTRFPDGAWDPLLMAGAIAAAFAAKPGWTTTCDPKDPPVTAKELQDDEAQLRWYSDQGDRSDADLGAAINLQATDISQYWANLLACSAASRPATWALVLIGLQVGGLVAAYFKLKYMRARPAQVWTAIAPSIATPPHPSYPSGHALQAFLIAECVKLAVPAMAKQCDALADQIALNRERAGVHFASDTEASRRIRPHVLAILRRVSEFERILGQATNEWAGAACASPPKKKAPPRKTPKAGAPKAPSPALNVAARRRLGSKR